MKRVIPWLITVALLAGAWLVALATPETSGATRAFIVQAAIGEPAQGRNLAVTVHDVRVAEAISTSTGWRAEGTWVVVDLDAESVLTQYGTLLSTTTLTIGERTFSATERGIGDSLDYISLAKAQLVPGIPKRGMLAFQVPDDALSETATLELALGLAPVYDSIIALSIDLSELPVEHDVRLVPVDWSGS